MKRIIALQYSSGRLMGVSFKPEKRGNVIVGVALVEDEKAGPFEAREHFEVEEVEAAEVPSTFPADFPLLAPQRAALARAGLDSLEKVRAHDFARQKVRGISDTTVATIQKYLSEQQAGGQPGQEQRDGSDQSN